LSVSKTTVNNNAIAIFTETDCHIVKLDKQILQLLYKLLNKAKSSNSILLNGDVVNGLYICGMDDIDKSNIQNNCNLRYNNSHSTTNGIYTDMDMSIVNHIKRVNASYYSNVPSVHLDSIKELVRYFHEAWNHASVELMCLIIKHKLILNLPKQLTEKSVRKHFPNCNACPAGNLQKRPFLSVPVFRSLLPGEEWELDIMGPFTDRKGKRCRSFSGNLYALTCKDISTGKRVGFLLRNLGYLLRYIKHLISFNCQYNKIVKIIRMDDQFYTKEIRDYLESQHILALQCIPYEHETLGHIERDNRTIREVILKNLADKSHLNEQFWGMCYKDIISKMDILPCPNDPTTNPYFLWYSKQFDLLHQPTIPFGAIVRAHVPLSQQSMLKERSIITYYVGFNNDKYGGILLYNPLTKQTIIRRSYRVMGPNLQPDSLLYFEAAYEEDGKFYYNEDTLLKDNNPTTLNKPNDQSISLVQPTFNDITLPVTKQKKNVTLSDPLVLTSTMDVNEESTSFQSLPSESSTQHSNSERITHVEPQLREPPVPYTSWVEYYSHLVAEDIKQQRLEHPDWYPVELYPPEDYEYIPISSSDINNNSSETKTINIDSTNNIEQFTNPTIKNNVNNLPVTSKKIPDLLHENQFGNDFTEINDPIPLNSSRKHKVHIPKPPPLHEIESEHFVVEKILNHKGQSNKPSTMQLYVKWYGWDDSENAWIKWADNQDLAALDTYLENNPDIVVPIFPTRNFFLNRSKKKARHIYVKKSYLVPHHDAYGNDLKYVRDKQNKSLKNTTIKPIVWSEDDKQYIFNYHPPKTCSIAAFNSTNPHYHWAYAAYRKVPIGTPRNFADISKLDDKDFWFTATQVELDNMYRNKVWENITVDISSIPKHLILPSQLIFDKQLNPDRSLKKYKCRLVIRGDKWYDVYNMNHYASTVKSELVRMCMSIAAIEDMEMECVDVKAAFLYPELKKGEEIYMRRPPGLTDAHMPAIVKIKKCLYGMPQASAYFHAHSDAVLRSFGCVPTPEDDCCYTLHYRGQFAIINKHVDDFGLMSKSKMILEFIKSKLAEVYEITIDTDMHYYLGYNIIRDRIKRSITLNQIGYIEEFLLRYNIDLSNPFPTTPMDYNNDSKNTIKEYLNTKDIVDFQSRVGTLLYLAIQSRPDILYAVACLTSVTKSPTTQDMKAVNRVMAYVAGTKDIGLCLHSDSGVTLYATVDASYACHEDFKSHTGCTLHIGRHSGSIITQSKKQKVVADSSTIAEFIATHIVVKEIMWARRLLASLGYPQVDPTILYEDNLSTISMINNKCNGKRTKHIEVRYNLVREQVVDGVIVMRHLRSSDMTSDILTKPLAPGPFTHLRKMILGLVAILLQKYNFARY